MRVGIALGSNLGDRVAHLRSAAAAVRALGAAPILTSRIYETTPVDCPPGSPAFLNAAMEIGYSGDLRDLIRDLQAVERAHQRPADHGRNAPRTVDLDILYADELILETPELTLPHPRLMERMFVLRPLCDFAPHRRLPGETETFAARLASLSTRQNELITATDASL